MKIHLQRLLIFLGAFRLVYVGAKNADDFLVYWKSTQVWLQTGSSPYLPYLPDHGFIYKYPPWTVPFFIPFALLHEDAARLAWMLFGIVQLTYCVHWIMRQGTDRWVTYFTLVCFWFVWIVHFHDGQITLTLLTAALFWEQNRKSSLRTSLMGVAFSAKVFSLITLLGAWKSLAQPKLLLRLLAWTLLFTTLVLAVQAFHGHPSSYYELFLAWRTAASSGGTALPAEFIRGGFNQGLIAALMRVFSAPPEALHLDLIAFLALSSFLLPLWYFASKPLSKAEKWSGWLALGVILHPLAWTHSFVLAFPLCALSLGAAAQSKKSPWVICSTLGILCVGIVTRNIVGDEVEHHLQLISLRSWGVCLSALSLIRVRQEPGQPQLSPQQP